MRIAIRIVGFLFMVTGLIWFLQGINVFPGSFMTGQKQWAIYGALCFVTGAGLLVWQGSRPR